MALIEFKHVDFKYSNNSEENILNDLSFKIKEGEFVSVIGGSGCGKSTLLSLLSGLNHADSGKVLIGGNPVTGPGKDRGVVFQHYALFPWMRAKKNVEFGIKQVIKADRKTISDRAEKYLEMVGLKGSEELFPFQLSGGMQQRVAIARLLAMDTQILLMDEPFGAIDAKNKVELQELLLDLLDREDLKKTVVFVTHDIDEAILLSDRILFVRDHGIYRDLKVPFGRPRVREQITSSNAYHKFRRELFDLFYENDVANEYADSVEASGSDSYDNLRIS